MERKFKPGDEVCLPSGGATMTVKEYVIGSSNERLVKCVWFDGQGNLQERDFPENILRRWDTEDEEEDP